MSHYYYIIAVHLLGQIFQSPGLGVMQGETIKGNLDMNHLGTTCVGSTSGETLKWGLKRLSKMQALSGL